MDSERVFSRKPSNENIHSVYLAGSSYTHMDDETKHDLKIMHDNYNKYNDLMLRHYHLKKWATVLSVLGMFFIWAIIVLAVRPQ